MCVWRTSLRWRKIQFHEATHSLRYHYTPLYKFGSNDIMYCPLGVYDREQFLEMFEVHHSVGVVCYKRPYPLTSDECGNSDYCRLAMFTVWFSLGKTVVQAFLGMALWCKSATRFQGAGRWNISSSSSWYSSLSVILIPQLRRVLDSASVLGAVYIYFGDTGALADKDAKQRRGKYNLKFSKTLI